MVTYRFYPSDLTKGLLGLAVSYAAMVYAIRKLNANQLQEVTVRTTETT